MDERENNNGQPNNTVEISDITRIAERMGAQDISGTLNVLSLENNKEVNLGDKTSDLGNNEKAEENDER